MGINRIEDTLTLTAFHNLQRFFEAKGHRPSPVMLEGLRNLLDTLSSMLTGDLSPKYYLSSLDPGVGKTSAIRFWLDAYLPTKDLYGDKGIIICFDRLEEIECFIKATQLPEDSYGVLVSNSSKEGKALNMMGVGYQNVRKATVLLTTKQQIIRRSLDATGFKQIEALYYCDEPRRIRIWDESVTVGKALTITASQILELVHTIEKNDTELALTIIDLATTLRRCKDKDVIDFPDVGGLELNYNYRWRDKEMRNTAETLGLLSGRVVTIRVDGKGRIALDCVQSLPDDLKPCLVTDASARIRETYNLQEDYRQDVERLHPITSCKSYQNLCIYIWNRSTSKETYRRSGVEEVAKEVSKVILTRPGEEFLVVVNKENRRKMKDALKELLPHADMERIRFLTWGRHTATNDYVEVPNIIITSQLCYRQADYEAGARAAATLSSSQGFFSPERLQAFRKGETAHHLLQCICRGAVRKAVGNGCPPSRCWIIAAKGMNVDDQLPNIFPGCTIERWNTESKGVKKIKEQVLDFIIRILASRDHLPASEVRKAFGFNNTSNFKRDYLDNPEFTAICFKVGVLITTDGSRPYFTMNPFQPA